MKRLTRARTGFTILEVIIVLAIAGLLFSIIFLAVNNAERSSRDAARRTDVQQLSTALEQWAQNHSGELPVYNTDVKTDTSTEHLISDQATSPFCYQNYLPNNCNSFVDPLTKTKYKFQNGGAFVPEAGASALDCSGPGDRPGSTGNRPASINVLYKDSRTYTIKICLESGDYTLNP